MTWKVTSLCMALGLWILIRMAVVNEDAASRKIEMFDEGETQLMRDVQLALPQHDPTCNPAPLGRTRGPKLAFANSGRPGHLHVD